MKIAFLFPVSCDYSSNYYAIPFLLLGMRLNSKRTKCVEYLSSSWNENSSFFLCIPKICSIQQYKRNKLCFIWIPDFQWKMIQQWIKHPFFFLAHFWQLWVSLHFILPLFEHLTILDTDTVETTNSCNTLVRPS